MKKIVFILLALLLLTGCTAQREFTQDEPITIYLVRHGETMQNVTHHIQGWTDSPLTPAGIQITEKLGQGFKEANVAFDKVVTSDSGRAVETGEIILQHSGQEALVPLMSKNKNLREYFFGSLEGLHMDEMSTSLAETQGEDVAQGGFAALIKLLTDTVSRLDQANAATDTNWPAEDYQTLADRSIKSIQQIIKEAEENNQHSILVVSHGMTITTIIAELDPGKDLSLPLGGPENLSVQKIIYQAGKYTVEAVNDLSFIKE